MGKPKPPRNPATYARPYDAQRIAKIRAAFALKSKQELKDRAAKGNASMTPEQRSARTQKAWDTTTGPLRDVRLKRTIHSATSNRNRSKNIKRGLKKLGEAWRSERAQKRWDKLTPRQRKEATRHLRAAWNALSPSEQSKLISEGLLALTPKQRSEIVRKGWKNLTPLERDARIWHGITSPKRTQKRINRITQGILNKQKQIANLSESISRLRTEMSSFEHTMPSRAREALQKSNEQIINKNRLEAEIDALKKDKEFWERVLGGYDPPIPRRTEEII